MKIDGRKLSHAQLEAIRFQAVKAVQAGQPPTAVAHTTEFTYQRDRPELIGITKCITNSKRDLAGNPRMYTACGILMHSSLAITTAGLPLGLCAVKFWNSRQVQGNRGAQKKDQSNAGPHREEREHPMAGELKTVHRTSRRSGTLHPYRRP